jgi:ABC-type multidrug transport system ATPase subunit
VNSGETVALVGSSGSGKTTLVSLIPRFYQPLSGQITLDGIALDDIVLADLRQHIAMVSQDVVLFNDTVAANIAYGCSQNISREQIIEAARAANALEFIEAMPEGLDTQIGENGVRLSGGQRQRLAIARALLKNAPLLILDEATSALDTQSERLVQAALENLMKNRTTIVIAHRLSTIENADRIIVMHQGKVAEQGSHQQLMQQDGIYARLHSLQFREPEADAADGLQSLEKNRLPSGSLFWWGMVSGLGGEQRILRSQQTAIFLNGAPYRLILHLRLDITRQTAICFAVTCRGVGAQQRHLDGQILWFILHGLFQHTHGITAAAIRQEDFGLTDRVDTPGTRLFISCLAPERRARP